MLIHRQQQLSWSCAALTVLLSCACLLILHVDQVTSMSLDRLGVERNDIQQTPAKTTAINDAEELVIDDDRRLTPVPTQDDQISDMYVLLPSLDKNTIEVDPNTSDGEIDMLMVESNQEPVVAASPVSIDTQHIVEVVSSEPEKAETVKEQNFDIESELEEISTQTTNIPAMLNENDSLPNIDKITEKLSDETNVAIQHLADKPTDSVSIFSEDKLPSNQEEISVFADKQPVVDNEENTYDNDVTKAEVEENPETPVNATEDMVEKFESVVNAITDMVGEAESMFENGEMDSEKEVANKDDIVQEHDVPVINIEQQEESTDAQLMAAADELPEKIIETANELPEQIVENPEISLDEQLTINSNQLKDEEQATELPQKEIEIENLNNSAAQTDDLVMEDLIKLDTEKVDAATEKGSVEMETITEKSEQILESEQAQQNALLTDAVTETFTDSSAETITDLNTPVKTETEIIANEETDLNMENAATFAENPITEKAEIAADASEKVDKLESEANDSHDIVQQDQIDVEPMSQSEQQQEVEKEEAEQQAVTEFSVAVTEKNVENESEFVTEAIVETVSQIINDEKPQAAALEAETSAPTDKEPESSTLLASIIQIPNAVENVKVEEEAAKPIKMENIVMHTEVPDNNKNNNQSILNVIDSVLNYVNASFINNNNKQQQPLNDEHTDDMAESFRPSLRSYEGAQVWRILVQNDRDRKLADELRTKYDGQLWKEVKQEVDYLLKPHTLVKAAQHIRAANLSRVVLIDNLQNIIDVENPPAEQIAQLQNRKGHRLTWQAYHRLEDIHGFYDYLAKTYPDICSVETIGYSIEKRPLKILKISNGHADNPGIWLDGGMHAREWISPASVTYIANEIVEGWDDLPAHMKNVNWHIHAVANPDGYEHTHTTDRLWRKNMRTHGRECPGVDLNRNFGYMWGGKGTSANPCSQIYRGNKAFSEPEAFYISKYLSSFPRGSFSGYLSFHSYGQYILYPWGYDYTLPHDNSDLDRVARQAATAITKSTGVKYTVGTSATTLYPAAGGSDDWAKGFAGIKYSYTIEMGDTGRYGFVLPAKFIENNGKDAYTFAETVARAVTQDQMRRRRGF